MSVEYGLAIIEKTKRIWREEGFHSIFKKSINYVYNRSIWPLLPTTDFVTHSGIRVEKRKWLDSWIPFSTPGTSPNIPEFEAVLVPAVRQYVSSADTVVEIGGGIGVTAVIAAEQAGKSSRVITFEASPIHAKKIRKTVALNGVGDIVTVENAIVNNAVRIMKGNEENPSASVVSINDLPKCDTLIIDCDGCEFDILKNLSTAPSTIIVEHHAVLDSKVVEINYRPDHLRNVLEDMGYDIVETKIQSLAGIEDMFGEEETVFVGELSL